MSNMKWSDPAPAFTARGELEAMQLCMFKTGKRLPRSIVQILALYLRRVHGHDKDLWVCDEAGSGLLLRFCQSGHVATLGIKCGCGTRACTCDKHLPSMSVGRGFDINAKNSGAIFLSDQVRYGLEDGCRLEIPYLYVGGDASPTGESYRVCAITDRMNNTRLAIVHQRATPDRKRIVYAQCEREWNSIFRLAGQRLMAKMDRVLGELCPLTGAFRVIDTIVPLSINRGYDVHFLSDGRYLVSMMSGARCFTSSRCPEHVYGSVMFYDNSGRLLCVMQCTGSHYRAANVFIIPGFVVVLYHLCSDDNLYASWISNDVFDYHALRKEWSEKCEANGTSHVPDNNIPHILPRVCLGKRTIFFTRWGDCDPRWTR